MSSFLKNSFFILLLLVAAFEGYWYLNLPYSKAIPAAFVTRNEFNKRAWPEFTSGQKPINQKLAVLIGNSQSCGYEYASDSSVIYPYFLKRDLYNSNILLENWSIRGIRTTDIEILTTKAMVKGADLVILSLNPTNFDAPENINLSFPNTDVKLLLSDWEIYRAMQNSLLAKHLTFETWLNMKVTCSSNLIRSRTPVFTSMSDGLTLNDQIFYFGNPITRNLNPDLLKTKNFRNRINHKTDLKEIQATKEAEFIQRVSTFMQFCRFLKMRAESLQFKGEIVFVWQPIGMAKVPYDDARLMNAFNHIACSSKEINGFTFYNHVNALPVQVFETFAHFDATGHKLYAGKLALLIKNELQ